LLKVEVNAIHKAVFGKLKGKEYMIEEIKVHFIKKKKITFCVIISEIIIVGN